MNRKELKEKLKEFTEELEYDEKSKNTVSQYARAINSFIDSLDHDEEITKNDLMNFKKKIIEKYKPATVKNTIIIVNKFICYCEYGSLDRNKKKSDKEVKQIKTQHVTSLEDVLEPIDLKRLLRNAKKMGYMDMYLIMKIFAYTGIREQELKDFTVENLKKSVIYTNSKGKTREIIVRGDLKREINKYVKSNNIESGYIFTSPRDPQKLLSAKTIWWRLKKIAAKAKVKKAKVHAHSFRHLFAIWYVEQGGTVEELADILGHNSTETTRIYIRSTVKMKKKRLENMKY